MTDASREAKLNKAHPVEANIDDCPRLMEALQGHPMSARTEAEALPKKYVYRYEIHLEIQAESLKEATELAMLAANVAGFSETCKTVRLVSLDGNNNPPLAKDMTHE